MYPSYDQAVLLPSPSLIGQKSLAQTQGVSESAAVAASSNQFALRKSAATLVILT